MTLNRDAFDLPDDVSYLNSAYLGPLPRRSAEVAVEAARLKTRPWEVSLEHFFEPVERARTLFAELVGGDSAGVAIVPSVSYGLAVAAENIPLSEGDEVLMLAEQFPSAIYTFVDSARRAGASHRLVARPEDDDWTRAVLEGIGERTKVVCVPHCHWTDGARLNLVEIGAAARRVGAKLVVDGCQSIGAMPFDVREIQPDFVVTAAYKWLLGPYSLGFLWVADDHRSGHPIEHNWITRKGSEDFAGLVDYRDEYQPGARRFDVGETSNFALMPVAVESLAQIVEHGVAQVAAHGRTLIEHIAHRAEALGLGVVAPDHRSPHLTGVRLGERNPSAVARALAEHRIFVSVRGTSMRISAHVYNDERDVDRLFDVLAEL